MQYPATSASRVVERWLVSTTTSCGARVVKEKVIFHSFLPFISAKLWNLVVTRGTVSFTAFNWQTRQMPSGWSSLELIPSVLLKVRSNHILFEREPKRHADSKLSAGKDRAVPPIHSPARTDHSLSLSAEEWFCSLNFSVLLLPSERQKGIW